MTRIDIRNDGTWARYLNVLLGAWLFISEFVWRHGQAAGTKLNLPLLPGSGDAEFHRAWGRVEEYLRAGKPDFILFQCGADSIAGDPITHLRFTPAAHAHAARRLCVLAEELGHGRVVGMGGGGYNRTNIALGWNGVLESFLAT